MCIGEIVIYLIKTDKIRQNYDKKNYLRLICKEMWQNLSRLN